MVTGAAAAIAIGAPTSFAVAASRKGARKSLDVLAGGYVVIAGRHANGRAYPVDRHAGRTAARPAPQWALALLRAADVVSPDRRRVARDHHPHVDLDSLSLSAEVRRKVVDETCGPSVRAALGRDRGDDARRPRRRHHRGRGARPRNGVSSKPLQQGRKWLATGSRAHRKRPIGVL